MCNYGGSQSTKFDFHLIKETLIIEKKFIIFLIEYLVREYYYMLMIGFEFKTFD